MRQTVENTPIRVLYILGHGRSGSTVLDTVLGAHPSIESVGELVNLPRRAWVNGEYCACGTRGHLCPFWTEVRNMWIERSRASLYDYILLQQRFERIRDWPRLLREKRHPSEAFRTYANQTRALYEIIRSLTGKAVLVDSSKAPARAIALSMIDGIDLRVVHLVRDGRGIVWSFQKHHRSDDRAGLPKEIVPTPAWRSSLTWRIGNLLAERALHTLAGKSLRVRYEDLIAEPQLTLERIGSLAELDLTLLGTEIARGAKLKVGHTVAGNRMRMQGEIQLKGDWEWRERLTPRDRMVFWALAGATAKRYGYSRDV